MDLREVLSAEEAAAALGITPGRVRVLIRAGRLPARKLAGRWVVVRDDLAMVAQRRPGRPAHPAASER
jgi:excisionase family DNA binding protein